MPDAITAVNSRLTARRERSSTLPVSTQKEILKAFGMTATNVKEQAIGINEDLLRSGMQEAQ